MGIENIVLGKKIITNLAVGDTFEKLEEYLKSVQLSHRSKPEGLERFITRIERPIFIRLPENFNTNTFDYIYVDLCIIHEWEEDKKQYIEKNKKDIYSKVLNKVANCSEFKKIGIPINFLEASRITLRKDDILQFVLELKKI